MKIILMIMAASVITAAPCCGQPWLLNEDARVFEGKVTAVDKNAPSITVKGIAEITFPISPDTQFIYDIYDIELSDINIGDYVTVEYDRLAEESRVPNKVIKVTVKYKANE